MRLSAAEKYEIIQLVDRSELGVNRTLKEMGIHKSTFYKWYQAYLANGLDGLQPHKRTRRQWNSIPDAQKQLVVEVALEFKDKTHFVHDMWQTDFTYFKIIGWGWYYLSTILDDYSRYIVHWELCRDMKASDVERTVDRALAAAGLKNGQRPKLLSDNGSCYISADLKKYLFSKKIKPIHGRANHPQTQGKIERYHRSMKNIVKLDNYYCPEELNEALEKFVNYYNHHRYHESLDNVTPADVYFGKKDQILKRREKIKAKNMSYRRALYFTDKLSFINPTL